MIPSLIHIGVVGGDGQMGRWLRRFWQDLGYEVAYSDRDTELTNEHLVRWADLTFVAVPLRTTPSVLQVLAPQVPVGRALVSIASIMGPSAAALAEVGGEALCAHPVFGPTVAVTAGLPVVLAPVRGEHWCRWLLETLQGVGLRVRLSTPEDHDAKMSMVQALLHSLYVALCTALAEAGLPAAEALEWASPTLRLQLGLMARILGQDPELYADLVVGNPHSPTRLQELAAVLQRLADLARDGDRAGFAEAFLAARSGFGEQMGQLAAGAEEALAQLK